MNMSQAYRATAPHPFAYVITKDTDGRANAMGISWWTFASSNPPTMLACLSSKKHSIQVIRRTMQFSLCLPDVSLREQARKVCSTSGANIDKVQELGIALVPAQVIDAPVLKDARACFECRVQEIREVGDHALCIAEIVAFSENPEKEALRTTPAGYAL